MCRQRLRRWGALCGLLLVLTAGASWLDSRYPLPPLYPDGPSTVVVARDGQVLRSFGDRAGVHRYLIELDQVDPFYLEALLNYEDRWFHYHPGVNPFALGRAALQWLYHGQVVSGGSTLTMQVARLLSPHSRTLAGKLQQMLRALQLEWHFSKEEILTLYLNLAPFGGNIQGVEAAARRYFDKSAAEITANEAALLVVLPQKPSRYRPDRYPQLARQMRNKVLQRSLEGELLSGQELALLAEEPVSLSLTRPQPRAPLLSRRLKAAQPRAHVIRTSIDGDLQSRIADLMARHKSKLPARASAAALVVENRSGRVLGYQGSVDFSDGRRFSHVDMVQAVRSPGSALKPFIYGLALEEGLVHSQSLLSDVPTSFEGYKPRNLNGRFSGAVSLSYALQRSLNVPAIQVFHRLTPQGFDDRLRGAGIELAHRQANLSVGLGGTGMTLWELARLYRSMAMKGEVTPLSLSPESGDSAPRPMMSAAASWIIFDTLSDVSAPDRVVPKVRRQLAWKTGTSSGLRDFWSIGVSADYTVAVWVGRADAVPLVGYLGATKAAPLMFDLFDLLPRDGHSLVRPAEVEKLTVCWPGGRALASTPAAACELTREAWTVAGMTPPTLQSSGEFVVEDHWPQRLKLWQARNRVVVEGDRTPLSILGIRSGQHYFKDQLEALPLQASLASASLEWYVNHQRHPGEALVLADYLGEVNISVCLDLECDRRTIVVH